MEVTPFMRQNKYEEDDEVEDSESEGEKEKRRGAARDLLTRRKQKETEKQRQSGEKNGQAVKRRRPSIGNSTGKKQAPATLHSDIRTVKGTR